MKCIKCKKEKNSSDMCYKKHQNFKVKICVSCRRDEVYLQNLEKATTQEEKTELHLRNIIRNLVEALEDRDSKKLRKWGDVGRLEIGRQIANERWNSYVAN